MEIKVKIKNEEGMHARPAGVFVKTANQFASKIELKANGKSVNGKSVMSIMSLELQFDDELTICALGDDADKALPVLESLVQNKFSVQA